MKRNRRGGLRKLAAIALSLAMFVTFMPAMAFAGENVGGVGDNNWYEDWKYELDKTNNIIKISVYKDHSDTPKYANYKIPAHATIDGTTYTTELAQEKFRDYSVDGKPLGYKQQWLDTGNIEKLSFESGVRLPDDCSKLFSSKGGSKLTDLDLTNLDTSNVTNMYQMFLNRDKLTNLNLGKFDTSKVINMESMFSNCKSLTNLNVSKFNTSNVTDMAHMFEDCRSLTNLDVSKFNTSNVTDMWCMFDDCNKLTSLDVSKFDTSKVTNMTQTFQGCESLTNLDVSKFNTSNVTKMMGMFQKCKNITSLDVSKFDTSKVVSMARMFDNCKKLVEIDVSKFDTSKVGSTPEFYSELGMAYMFASCESLTDLNVSNFDTSNVTNMESMFNDCKKLTSLDLSNFNTSKVKDMYGMFKDCKNIESLNLSNFDTSGLVNDYFKRSNNNMFENCSPKKIIFSSSFDFPADREVEGNKAPEGNYTKVLDSTETLLDSAKRLKSESDKLWTADNSDHAGTWYKDVYNITYNLNGGKNDPANPESYTSYSSAQVPDIVIIPGKINSFNEDITLKDPTRPGYKFAGWKDDNGNIITKIEKGSTGDRNLTAMWGSVYIPPVTQYTLSYDANGGSPAYKTETYSSGTNANADNNILKKTPTRDGYKFAGWFTDEELTDQLEDGERFIMNDNKTVYAKWEKVEEDKPDLNKTDHFGYVTGYEDGTVRPESNITRAETGSIFFRLLSEKSRAGMWKTTNNFGDVQANDWFNNAVSTIANGGIVGGYPDGTFKPNNPITRAEFATIAAQFDSDTPDTSKSEFTDISGHWAENYIKKAEALGYISGYPDGSFKPDQYITRAEAMSLINRVLDRDTVEESGMLDKDMIHWIDNADKSAWYYEDVQEATNSHNWDKKDGKEVWTGMRENRDWKAVEQPGGSLDKSENPGDITNESVK